MSLSLWTQQQTVPGDSFKVCPLKWMPIAVDFLCNHPSAWLIETKQGNEMQTTILTQHLYGDWQLYKSLGIYKWCIFIPAVSHEIGCILPQRDILNSQGGWWKTRARSPYQIGPKGCNINQQVSRDTQLFTVLYAAFLPRGIGNHMPSRQWLLSCPEEEKKGRKSSYLHP